MNTITEKIYNNRLYNLPEDVLNIILSFHNPYKTKHNKLVFDLRWIIWWFNMGEYWLGRTLLPFHTWALTAIPKIKQAMKKRKGQAIKDTKQYNKHTIDPYVPPSY